MDAYCVNGKDDCVEPHFSGMRPLDGSNLGVDTCLPL